MRKKKVLIVEDEAIAALGLKSLVEEWGYEACEFASSGEEAIQGAMACEPDIILMDVNLGDGMDGIEAVKIIRSKKEIPVIFISGYSDDHARGAGFLTVVEYISKPVNFDELEQKMQFLLNQTVRE